MKSGSVLAEADGLVNGDRQDQYGHPWVDYSCTADMWAAMINRRYGVDIPITPDFACLMMVAVKLSREAGKPKRDNLVDAAGYIACAEKCLDKENDLNSVGETFGALFSGYKVVGQPDTAPCTTEPHFSDTAKPGDVVHIEVIPPGPISAARTDTLEEERE